ncbi:MAG: ABC transporter ATP-binding protein/permease [Alphaproteobacteria bacterium]|nr:ABC transporter ATP-binding protein/permease [Alphaproteobacteria bacterium]
MIKAFLDILRLMWLGANTPKLKFRLVLNIACGAFAGFFIFLNYYLLSTLLSGLATDSPEVIRRNLVFLVASSMSTVVLWWVFRYFAEFLCYAIPFNLRKYYYNVVYHKSYSWHLKNSVGYFQSMLEKVMGVVNNWCVMFSWRYVSSAVFFACFFIYTYFISPYLMLYFLVCIVVMVATIRTTYNKRMRLVKEFSILDRLFGKAFTDFLYNVRTVKKMNLLSFTTTRLEDFGSAANDKYSELQRHNSLQWGLQEFFIRAQFLIPLVYFVLNFIKTGEGLSTIILLATVQGHMSTTAEKMMHFMSETSKFKEDLALLAGYIDNTGARGGVAPRRKWKKICFRNTCLRLDADTERDLGIFEHRVGNFEIARGEHIAVMGKSGEGKTTFLNLLTRQFGPCEGCITLDDTPYNSLPQSFFDSEFTYISQDVELFDMSFYDNITMGRKVSRAKLDEVLRDCCLDDLVKRLKGNLDTDIGEKGVRVSAGEKQRINLARGLLLDRSVLVLDEITANLDPATTSHIWRSIFKKHGDKTIIAISHEPELVRHVGKKLRFKSGVAKPVA